MDLNQHLKEAAEQYEQDTGHEFRTALRQYGSDLHWVVMPSDLGIKDEKNS